MRAGETAVYHGNQVALLPFDYVDITQNSAPGSFSHCCGTATDFQFPTGDYPVYAPFDCHETSPYDSASGRSFTSDNPVWTVNFGLCYVTIRFVHDESPMQGTSFRQGQVIAHSGQAGYALGDHCHFDCAPIAGAGLVDSGYSCSGTPSQHCYYMASDQRADKIFYLTGTETVINTTANGITQSFSTWQGGPISGGRLALWMIAKRLKERRGER